MGGGGGGGRGGGGGGGAVLITKAHALRGIHSKGKLNLGNTVCNYLWLV